MIIKVQRELGPNPDATMMIYTRDSDGSTDHLGVFPMTNPVKALLEDDLKGYFKAYLSKGKVHIVDRVDDQDW